MPQTTKNRLVQMQEDIRRSLKKPPEKRAWLMVINIDKCIGCHACEVSCIAENASPPGVSYRVVKEVETGDYPDVKRVFMPTNCQQCDNPPCVKGLPAEAYTKRPDGVLVFHYEKMKGKKLFEQVEGNCPYTAVYHDTGKFYTENTPQLQAYETRPVNEYGKKWDRKSKKASPVDALRKCHFCVQRLEAGLLPACVGTCVGGAMYFGDENDPDGLIHKLLKKGETIRLLESEGTRPRVVYLAGAVVSREECEACHG